MRDGHVSFVAQKIQSPLILKVTVRMLLTFRTFQQNMGEATPRSK